MGFERDILKWLGVKIGKILIRNSLENKLEVLFLNSLDGEPTKGTFKIGLKPITPLSLTDEYFWLKESKTLVKKMFE